MYPVHDHTSWHIVLVTSTYHHYTVFLKQILMNHTLCPNAGSSHEVCDWWPQLLHGQSKESGTGTSVTVSNLGVQVRSFSVNSQQRSLCGYSLQSVMLYMLNVCCTQFGVRLSLYSSVHLQQNCAICSCTQWWERWNGSRKQWLYNSAKYKVAMKMIVKIFCMDSFLGVCTWLHCNSNKLLPWPWVCISSVFLTPVYGLRNVGCASYVISKCGLCFIWNKCAGTSLHTEAYCSKIFKEIQAFANYWERLSSTEMLQTSYFYYLKWKDNSQDGLIHCNRENKVEDWRADNQIDYYHDQQYLNCQDSSSIRIVTCKKPL